jgi:hypothetical protein
MKNKTTDTKPRYAPEDLESRDPVADEARMDAWLQRNKDALNASAKKALEEFKRGEYFSDEDVTAALKAHRLRRHTGKA